MFWVYALINRIVNKIYIGQTINLETRLLMHNRRDFDKTSYTHKNKGKWEIFYKENFKLRKEALKREKQLKSYQGRKFLRKLLQNGGISSMVEH
jgi:putative endonuclease